MFQISDNAISHTLDSSNQYILPQSKDWTHGISLCLLCQTWLLLLLWQTEFKYPVPYIPPNNPPEQIFKMDRRIQKAISHSIAANTTSITTHKTRNTPAEYLSWECNYDTREPRSNEPNLVPPEEGPKAETSPWPARLQIHCYMISTVYQLSHTEQPWSTSDTGLHLAGRAGQPLQHPLVYRVP